MTTKMKEKFAAIIKDLSPAQVKVAFDFVEYLKEKELRWDLSKRPLDADLLQALKEYRAGHYYGPFETAEEGVKFLRTRREKVK